MPFGRPVRILACDRESIRRVVHRARAAFIFPVLGDQQLTLQRMVVRREAQTVRVAETPSHWLDRVLRARNLRAQDGAGAHAFLRTFERGHLRPRPELAVTGIAALNVAIAGIEPAVAQRNVLAGDLVLVDAAAVVVTGDARVGGGALRPVEPAVLDHDLLRRMVTGGQLGDDGRDRSGGQADSQDARAVVGRARRTAHALVRIRSKQRPAVEIVLERETDGGTIGLKATARGRGLAQWTGDLVAVLVEDQQVGCERIVGGELADPGYLGVVVALAGQAGARLEHHHLEAVLVADEGDVGRHVEPLREHLDLVALRYDDALAVPGFVEGRFIRTDRIGLGLRPRGRRNGSHPGQGEPDRDARQLLLGCY